MLVLVAGNFVQEWSEDFETMQGFDCQNPKVKLLQAPISLKDTEECEIPKDVVKDNTTVQILARNSSHDIRANQCKITLKVKSCYCGKAWEVRNLVYVLLI